MTGVKKISRLIHEMNPELINEEFVFCSIKEEELKIIEDKALMIFREKEGVTIITDKKTADNNSLKYDSTWSMITLKIHSSLNAIGFLAEITHRLAEAKISVNAVSAYYHDHLFVPSVKAKKAIKILEEI